MGIRETLEEIRLIGANAGLMADAARMSNQRCRQLRVKLEVRRFVRNLRTALTPLTDSSQIPEGMTEEQARRFWDTHEVTEEYLGKTLRGKA